jgi:hypothetical protein
MCVNGDCSKLVIPKERQAVTTNSRHTRTTIIQTMYNALWIQVSVSCTQAKILTSNVSMLQQSDDYDRFKTRNPPRGTRLERGYCRCVLQDPCDPMGGRT